MRRAWGRPALSGRHTSVEWVQPRRRTRDRWTRAAELGSIFVYLDAYVWLPLPSPLQLSHDPRRAHEGEPKRRSPINTPPSTAAVIPTAPTHRRTPVADPRASTAAARKATPTAHNHCGTNNAVMTASATDSTKAATAEWRGLQSAMSEAGIPIPFVVQPQLIAQLAQTLLPRCSICIG